MTLYKLAIRIDAEVSKTKQWFDDRSFAGFGVREISGDNEHWHFYVETKLKPDSFRVLLKREVPELKGNGGYSVAECRDEEKYWRYMSKGDGKGILPETVWKGGLAWTDERIEELHEAYWEENATLKKRRTESIIDVVLFRCKEKKLAWDSRSYIAEEYIKELVARKKPINIYSVRSNVNLIQVELCHDDSAIKMLSEQVML